MNIDKNMEVINAAQEGVDYIRKSCIGFLKLGMSLGLVISHDTDTNYTTYVIITRFGAIQAHYDTLGANALNSLCLFPEGETLYSLLKEPFEFKTFCENNKI